MNFFLYLFLPVIIYILKRIKFKYTDLSVRRDGIVLIFSDNLVIRFSLLKKFNNSYAIKRSALSKDYKLPAFQLSQLGYWQIEEFINPSFVLNKSLYKEFLKKLSLNLKKKETARNISTPVSNLLFRYLGHFTLPPKIDLDLVKYFLNCEFAITHGDLSPNNILVSSQKFYVIDISPSDLKYRLFWYDIVKFVIGNNKHGYFSGEFSNIFKNIFNDDEFLKLKRAVSSEIFLHTLFFSYLLYKNISHFNYTGLIQKKLYLYKITRSFAFYGLPIIRRNNFE